MTEENVKRLHALIVEKGTLIHNVLPSHTAHPHGRIGIAHIYSVIKSVMGVPMKECGDGRYNDIVEIVNYCVDNVHVLKGLTGPLHEKYEKEPVYEPVTLDDFM